MVPYVRCGGGCDCDVCTVVCVACVSAERANVL